MIFGNTNMRRRMRTLAGFVLGGVFILGIVEGCDDRMLTLTNYVDLCGTVFANCQPGDFQLNAASVPDYCIDPACTVPGQCGTAPLGLTTNLCP